MHRRHPLRPLVAELLRLPSVSSIELGPLTASAMAQHLTELSLHRLDAKAIDRMITRAEGNAYYAEELLEASSAGSQPPARPADPLVARVGELFPAAQQGLRTAPGTARPGGGELG